VVLAELWVMVLFSFAWIFINRTPVAQPAAEGGRSAGVFGCMIIGQAAMGVEAARFRL